MKYEELKDLVRRVHPTGKIMLDEAKVDLPEAARITGLAIWIDNQEDNTDTWELRHQLKHLATKGKFDLGDKDDNPYC